MNLISQQTRYVHGRPDNRKVTRVKLATLVPMDSSKWDLELSKPVNAPQMKRILEKYQDQSLETNLFFEKTFLAAAFGRMNTRETNLLTVSETIDSERYLRMYFPVVQERLGIPGNRVWRCWSHDYAPLGVPIVSQHDAGEVLDRFLQLLVQVESSKISTLIFQDIPLDGVFASRLRLAMEDSNTPYCQNPTAERAVLRKNLITRSIDIVNINSKMRRNYRRQQRRLGELGALELECVEGYKDVILRFEEFLLLEASGWKKNKGTSMLTIKQTAAFARQAVTDLAKYDQCAIYSIRLDGQSIASLIMLKSNGAYFPWKIAIDQRYSLYSPGALLMLRACESIGLKPDFIRADSLAGPSNRLVSPLMKQRMELGTLTLPIGNTSLFKVKKVSGAIRRENDLRNWAKKLLRKKSR